jgi:hypothetical protein
VIPGLLQTEEYTRALLTTYRVAETSIDRIVESRKERQELLDAEDLPEIYFIIDESVFLRPVGGIQVMVRQLDHLAAVAARVRISIQMIQLSAGSTEALKGGFVHLEFSDAEDSVVFLEDASGASSFIDNPDTTGPYQETFWRLEDVASRPADLGYLIEKAKEYLSGNRQ